MLYITLKNKKCFIIQKKIKNVVYNIKNRTTKNKMLFKFYKIFEFNKITIKIYLSKKQYKKLTNISF